MREKCLCLDQTLYHIRKKEIDMKNRQPQPTTITEDNNNNDDE